MSDDRYNAACAATDAWLLKLADGLPDVEVSEVRLLPALSPDELEIWLTGGRLPRGHRMLASAGTNPAA